MFSNLSSSSISLATETQSFVTVGAPKLFSSTTLRPRAQRDFDGVSENVDASHHSLAGIIGKSYFF